MSRRKQNLAKEAEEWKKKEDEGGSLNKKSQSYEINSYMDSSNCTSTCTSNCTTNYTSYCTTNYTSNCRTNYSTNCFAKPTKNSSTAFSTNSDTNYDERCLPDHIVSGNFSQGDKRFNIHSRGKQCTCNALAFLCTWSKNKDLTKDIIDLILYEGDRLYYNATFKLLQKQQMHEYLSFTDLLLLQPIQLYDQLCTFTLGQVYSGTLNCATNLNEARFAFEDALNEILAIPGDILVMIGTYAMALVKHNGKFGLFDSHAHSPSGMFHDAHGKAAFMLFFEVSKLSDFIRVNFPTSSLYEFQVVQIIFKPSSSPFQSESNCKTISDNQNHSSFNVQFSQVQSMVTYLQNQDKYSSKKRNKKSSDIGISPAGKRQRCGSITTNSNAKHQISEIRARCKNVHQQTENVDITRSDSYHTIEAQSKKLDHIKISDPVSVKTNGQKKQQTCRKKMSDSEKREKRRERDRERYRKMMSDPEKHAKHKEKQRKYCREKSDLEKREKHREYYSKMMSDHEKHEQRKEQRKESYRKKSALQGEKQREHYSKIISDPEKHEKRKQRQRECYRKKADLQKQEKQKKQREHYSKIMSDPEKHEKRKEQQREGYRKKKLLQGKLDMIETTNQKPDTVEVSQSISQDSKTLNDIIRAFHMSIKGPVFICSCCHQTWFEHSVTEVSTLSRSNVVLHDHLQRCLTGFISEQNKEWICHTCKQTILKGKVPKLSVLNNNIFPEKPPELELHQLEERLISLRIPFMQIRELPRGGQLSIKGNVVNVPTDITPTVKALPRSMDANETIPVKLKKKLIYKKYDFVENIRPIKVLSALHWLVQNSTLYKEADIHIDDQWLADLETFTSREQLEFMEDSHAHDIELSEDEDSDSSDNFSEIDEKDIHQGNADTLLEDADIGGDKTYTFAPGEGQVPLSMFSDADAEYLSFPTIFCGQRRKTNEERLVPIHYSDICKWELRCVDRRVSQSVPNLFFKLKKLQMKQISDKVNLSIRKCKTKGKKITVGSLLDENSVNNLVNLDEGFRVFRTLRNSPPYLESKKKDLFALIRQLGLPTFFMSLSAADTKWTDLLITLGKLVDNKQYSEDDIYEMDWAEKSRLIQSDPVTCARFFDFRVKQFIHNVLKSPCAPLGIIEDSFMRVEFQQRGSPHVHMLIWIKDAPVYAESSDEEVVSFIDQHISVSADVNPDLKQFLDYQMHKHSRTCRKGGRPICRFGHPKPPMSKTMILTPWDPLEEEDEDNELSGEHEKNLIKIQNMLGNAYQGDNITFEEFLENLELDEEQYIKAIRTSLKCPTIFLKRNPSEVRVNMYMKNMLGAWQANHDLQFVLDAYACAVYIVSYISKSESGMSSLMHAATKEAKQGNKSLKEQVRHIGNKFSNAVEISAQEAAYLVLQLPLTQSSRKVVFIPTSPPDERTFLVKKLEQLQELSPKSTDIQCGSLIQRYSQRPRQLENWCLADFASYLTIKWPHSVQDHYEESHEDDVCQDHDKIDSDEEAEIHTWPQNPTGTCEPVNIMFKSGIVIKQRKKPLVIRYVRYSKKVDPENYCRERILLFHPWRKEELDIKAEFFSFEAHYEAIKKNIEKKASNYEHNATALENAMADAHEEIVDEFDKIAPEKEQIEKEDAEIGAEPSEKYRFFEPPNKQKSHYDIGPDIGLAPSSACDNPVEYLVGRIPDEEFLQIIRSLNIKQMEFFTHVLQSIKMNGEQLKLFLTGGAGVGKSVLITALYQALHRILYSTPGENPEEIRILLCAPTGKAAYNIGGCTIHSAFKIPANQRIQYKCLSSDTVNTVRMKYRKLSMVIIDEVSMVGNRMFNFINLRLQEIKCCKKPFGGVHMILVGDLFQLPPVNDGWIFKDLDRAYGPLAVNIWEDAFQMYQLDQIMRQKDDYDFALMLNRIRMAQHTDKDIELLTQNIITDKDENYPYDYPHFFRTRKEVQVFNEAVFHKADTEKVIIVAQDSVTSDLPQAVKTIILERVRNLKNHSDTGQLMLLLPVAVSLQYMCTVNINVEDGIVNGSEGILRKIEYLLPQSSLPSILWLEFYDRNIGRQTRADYRQFYTHGTDTLWTPIFAISRTFLRSAGKVTVIRKQFPLEPCAAKTIHKAQGCTYDRIVVDLGTTKLAHSHYVALSRVRTICGLKILKLNPTKIAVDPKVVHEMTKLQDTPFNLCYTPLYQYQQPSFKILFHNARSAHKHFSDFCNNENYRAADILGIAESRLCYQDLNEDFDIPSFSIFRNDQDIQGVNRPPHGLITYYKTGSDCYEIKSFSSAHFEFTFIKSKIELGALNFRVQVIHLYLVHCNDTIFNRSMMILQDILDPQLPFVMLGDFNHDANDPCQKRTCHIEELFACKQIVTLPSHDSGSTLDQIYTNLANQHIEFATGVIDCCWSDHKAIYAVLQLHS